MTKLKDDLSRVRLIVDGKSAINELSKIEMEANDLKSSLSQIIEEQKKYEKESKNLDKIQARFDKLVDKARKLKEEGKQSSVTYQKNQKQIAEVAKQLRVAQDATEKLKDAQNRYNQESIRLDAAKFKMQDLRKEMGMAGMTLGQLVKHQKQLRNELTYSTVKGTAEYNKLREKLLQVNGAIRQQRAELNGTKGFFAGMGKDMKAFGMMALGAVGVGSLSTQFRSIVTENSAFSDSLADVQKTTGLTNTELEKLVGNLRAFDTRTPREELLGLAEIAGRLGIKGVKDIEGFVRAADMINVSLGDVLGDPEQVMKELGKLTDTFGVKEVYGIEESLLKVGSAINELGMASTANEGYMVEFAKRMSGIAPLAKISIEDILGLGATLDSLGQTAEVSSTALSQLFLSMAKNAETYAKYAGMEVSEFVDLLNNDANQAFINVLKGVKGNSEGISELASTLGDLGQDGGRVIAVLGTLANNWDKLEKQQTIANDAFKEGTSVYQEFLTKNENFAASLAKVQKRLAEMFVNSAIMNGLNNFVSKWAEWITIPVSETMEAERIELQKLHTRIISTNTDTEKRKDLINELKKTYPDYLSQIDADKVSNEQLSEAIQDVNKQLLNKIMIQQQEEEIIENTKRLAAEQKAVWDQQDKVLERINKIAAKHNITLKEGLSIEEQAIYVANEAGKNIGFVDVLMGSGAGTKLLDDLKQLEAQTISLNKVQEQSNFLQDEKTRLMNKMGLVDNAGGSADGGQSDADKEAAAQEAARQAAEAEAKRLAAIAEEERKKKAAEEYQKAKESYKKFLTDIADLEEERRIASLDKDSQEIVKIESKYDSMLEKARDYHSKKLIDDEAFAILETNLMDLQNQERDALIKEQSDKIKEDRQALIDEVAFLQMTAEEQELEKVRINYDNKIKEAQKYGLQTIELEELREAELAEIRKKYKEQEEAERQADIDRINQATMSEKDLALLENERYYDELIRLAQKHNIDITEIEQARADATNDITKDALDKDYQEYLENLRKKQELVMAFGDIVTNSMGAIAAITGNMNAFEKETALFKAAVNTGVAISNIVAAFSATSITPIDFAIKVATGIATVMANVGSAIATITGAKEPAKPDVSGPGGGAAPRQQGRAATASAKSVSSYYKGGETSDTGLGFGDRYGEYAGYVHKDEYVVPSFIRSHPYVADVLPAIEAIRKEKIGGFYKGGDTSQPSKPIASAPTPRNSRVEFLLESVLSKMDSMPKSIKAYLVDSELEEFREKRDMLKKKYVK